MVDRSTSSASVDIILPAYNAEETLDRAVVSVIDQPPLGHVIIIDDCSTDATRAVIQSLAKAHPKITPVLLDENVGPAEARNLGLQHSTSDWVTLLDSDDWMDPTRLSTLLQHAEKTGADIVADDIYMHRDEGEAVCVWSPDPFEPFFMDAAFFAQMNIADIAGTAREFGYIKPMFRAETLKRFTAPWRQDLRIMEDYDLYMRCLIAGDRFLFAPRAGYHYDRGAASRAFRPDDLRAIVKIDRDIAATTTDAETRKWVGSHADDLEALLHWVNVFGTRDLKTVPGAVWRALARPRIGAHLIQRLARRARGLTPGQTHDRRISKGTPAYRML